MALSLVEEDLVDTTVIIVVAVVIVLAVLVGVGVAIARRRRSKALQQQFGPEYDQVLAESGSRKEAESTLDARRERHDSLTLRPLDPATRGRFEEDWRGIQRSFLDDPGGSVEQADGLVTAIMRERGYPVEDFEQRAADLSVDHPRVVENYREARRVHDAHRTGSVDTEVLRNAVTSYRDLVEALLDESGDDSGGGRPGQGEGVSGRREGAGPEGPRDGSRR